MRVGTVEWILVSWGERARGMCGKTYALGVRDVAQCEIPCYAAAIRRGFIPVEHDAVRDFLGIGHGVYVRLQLFFDGLNAGVAKPMMLEAEFQFRQRGVFSDSGEEKSTI
jgi:hypothetical protein